MCQNKCISSKRRDQINIFLKYRRPCSLGSIFLVFLMQREFPGDFLRTEVLSYMTKAGEQVLHLLLDR